MMRRRAVLKRAPLGQKCSARSAVVVSGMIENSELDDFFSP